MKHKKTNAMQETLNAIGFTPEHHHSPQLAWFNSTSGSLPNSTYLYVVLCICVSTCICVSYKKDIISYFSALSRFPVTVRGIKSDTGHDAD